MLTRYRGQHFFRGEAGLGVRAIAVQSDGKILVGGNFTTFFTAPALIALPGLTRRTVPWTMRSHLVPGSCIAT